MGNTDSNVIILASVSHINLSFGYLLILMNEKIARKG